VHRGERENVNLQTFLGGECIAGNCIGWNAQWKAFRAKDKNILEFILFPKEKSFQNELGGKKSAA
jgi:hypothetical protein